MGGTSGQATGPFSDRNVSLEALAESEQRSRTLVESLPDAILVHSEDKIVFVNPFCVRLLGAAGPEQLLGKDIGEIINPDDLPAIRNRIQDCYASGTASPPMESVLIACDGSSVESKLSRFQFAGTEHRRSRWLHAISGIGNAQSEQFKIGKNAWYWHRRLAFGLDCGTGTQWPTR